MIVLDGSCNLILDDLTIELPKPGSDLELVPDPSLVIVPISGLPGPPGPPGDGSERNYVAAETVLAFRAVSLDAGGLAVPTRINTPAGQPHRFVGISTESGLTGEDVPVANETLIVTSATYPLGPLFVGPDGTLTSTPPSTGWQMQVATAITGHSLYVRQQLPILVS